MEKLMRNPVLNISLDQSDYDSGYCEVVIEGCRLRGTVIDAQAAFQFLCRLNKEARGAFECLEDVSYKVKGMNAYVQSVVESLG